MKKKLFSVIAALFIMGGIGFNAYAVAQEIALDPCRDGKRGTRSDGTAKCTWFSDECMK
jgi:hypothetical protein